MPYWQLFYHIVWSTKHRDPLLTPDLEPVVYDLVRGKASGLGAIVFALNGTLDHVHLVASVPPKLALSTFIGQVKGVSSVKVNQSGLCSAHFAWQKEYGIFSFDKKRLSNVIAYVEHQKQHHADQTVIPVLEQAEDQSTASINEVSAVYGDDGWHQELVKLYPVLRRG